MSTFREKYLKYKEKYLGLKAQMFRVGSLEHKEKYLGLKAQMFRVGSLEHKEKYLALKNAKDFDLLVNKKKDLGLKKQFGGACDCGKPECPECGERVVSSQPVLSLAEQAAACNAKKEITVNIVPMIGKIFSIKIDRNAKIIDLKHLIQRHAEYIHTAVYRQRLVFQPRSKESLDNELTLAECGIINDYDEIDILAEDPKEFDYDEMLKVKRLMRNKRTEELIYLLSQYSGYLYLEKFKINDNDLVSLADALKVNTTVTRINLKDNLFGNEGVALLANALEVNTTVTDVDLSNNTFNDEAAYSLAEMLKVNTTITNINLNQDENNALYKREIQRSFRVNSFDGLNRVAAAQKFNTISGKGRAILQKAQENRQGLRIRF